MIIQSKILGFSLLELLICLCLLGILVALACPSFKGPLNQAECLEARVLLLDAANRLENYYAAHQSYALAHLAELGANEWTEDRNYHLELNSSEENYQLRAVPQEREMCGVYLVGPQGLL